MGYHAPDILAFVSPSSYLLISTPRHAEIFLTRQLEVIAQHRKDLEAYPLLQVEPLEFVYGTLCSLSLLDAESLAIMLTRANWGGIVWGGWLALMRPNRSLAEPLSEVAESKPGHHWAAHCALAIIQETPIPTAFESAARLAGELSRAIESIALPKVPVRRTPTAEQEAELVKGRELVRLAYKEGGVDAALGKIRSIPVVHEYTVQYDEWLRTYGRRRCAE